VPTHPYVKNWQIFVCPSSAHQKPQIYDWANYGISIEHGPSWRFTGSAAANAPLYGRNWLEIYGSYLKNEEYLCNYGHSAPYYQGIGHSETGHDTPAQNVMLAEARDSSEDVDSNPINYNNGTYIEPGGTSWQEVWDQLSMRHNDGQNCTYLDGHSKWTKWDHFQSQDGKWALVPSMSHLGPDDRWP
jgi:hypothetical protein